MLVPSMLDALMWSAERSHRIDLNVIVDVRLRLPFRSKHPPLCEDGASIMAASSTSRLRAFGTVKHKRFIVSKTSEQKTS
jgi:hypothetical protein